MRFQRLIAAVAALLCCSTVAAGQELRATAIAEMQAAKAKQLKSYVPNRGEKLLGRLQMNFLSLPSGFHPFFGSVYNGGGAAGGGFFRRYYGEATFWDVRGLYSVKNYKWIELGTDSFDHAGGKLDFHARTGWRDATQVNFFGIGQGTSQDDKSKFRIKTTYVGGDARFTPVYPVVLGAGLSYEFFDTGSGTGGGPSIDEIYSPGDVPGLGSNPEYVHTTARAAIDWRPAAGYARRGGSYEVRYNDYVDRDDIYSFQQMAGEVVQHIPILRENWIVSLRGRVETTLHDDDVVPYFFLPSLGSGSTLRGFSSWRFRDRHSMLTQAEFRWTPSRFGMDMAIFYDAGKVTARRSDLDFNGLKSDVGIGVRFHGPSSTPVRIEFAFGDEGLNIVWSGSAAF